MSTADEAGFYAEGGPWVGPLLPDDDGWKGEESTKKASSGDKRDAKLPQPKTPSQEDQEIIAGRATPHEATAALAREIERILLRNAGRSISTSLINQVTSEREEADKKIRDTIASMQITKSQAVNAQNEEMTKRIRSLEETVRTLSNRVDELMKVSVTQSENERAVIQEAITIIRKRQEDEIGSNQTPSEVGRMEDRSELLERHAARFQQEITSRPSQVSAAANNRKKFAAIF